MKFYVRHREQYPETEWLSYALLGFIALGFETAPFYWIDEIDGMTDLGPDVGVVGYIDDVHRAFSVMRKTLPTHVDYPPELMQLLGRPIVQSTLGEVRRHPGRSVFVKPQGHKLFTGFVWTGDASTRRTIEALDDDVPVFVSEVVEFVSEYRSFVLDGEILDCRRYRGDWGVAPDRGIVTRAVTAMGEHAPRSYVLDWGVTSDGQTLLVEMNEGYSVGHYGLRPVLYARMLAARWHEMASGTGEQG